MRKQLFAIAALIMLIATPKQLNAQSASDVKQLSKKEKNEFIADLLQKLDAFYIFPDEAKKTGDIIRKKQKKGDYAAITDPNVLAKTMTQDIRDVLHDKHFGVRYSQSRPSVGMMRDTVADKKRMAELERFHAIKNMGFSSIAIMDGNIGYLKVDGFGPVEFVGKTCSAAMTFLNNTDAMIIDMRDNNGGEPEMVQYLCTHFFSETPVHLNDLYFREGNRTIEDWTLPKVDGLRYLDKPVYVLINGRTFSAGEEFTNNMKELKRATIIGETTGGGANPGDMVEIKHSFAAFIPNGRAINPISKTNWEGVGVTPDISTTPEKALTEAHILALKRLMESEKNEDVKNFFRENLEKVSKQ